MLPPLRALLIPLAVSGVARAAPLFDNKIAGPVCGIGLGSNLPTQLFTDAGRGGYSPSIAANAFLGWGAYNFAAGMGVRSSVYWLESAAQSDPPFRSTLEPSMANISRLEASLLAVHAPRKLRGYARLGVGLAVHFGPTAALEPAPSGLAGVGVFILPNLALEVGLEGVSSLFGKDQLELSYFDVYASANLWAF